MDKGVVELNHQQIKNARYFSVLKGMGADHPVFQEIRQARRAMVVMCSDGRFSADTLTYLRAMTGDADLHLYAIHGGALCLASGSPIIEDGSTLKLDLLKMMAVAGRDMGYRVLVNICHGPDCKALTSRNRNINEAFDHYCTVPQEVYRHLPEVRVETLFHRNKGDQVNRLYEFHSEAWKRLRRKYPEPVWLPGSEPVVAGYNN